jgi:ADP-ribose pyrophosphatase
VCGNRLFDVFFDRIRTPGGGIVEDFLIVRPRIQAPGKVVGVCVLPEIEGRIGLMRGFRHQLGFEIWQAPAGFVEASEAPAATALRELREETAYACPRKQLLSLGQFIPDAGLVEGVVALYVARNAKPSPAVEARTKEIGAGTFRLFGRRELRSLCRSSQDISGATLAACFRYLDLAAGGGR